MSAASQGNGAGGTGLAAGSAAVAALPAEALLDKELFRQRIPTRALLVPTRCCQDYMTALSKHLLNKPRQKNIQDTEDPGTKLLLLDEALDEAGFAERDVKWQGQTATLADVVAKEGLQVQEAALEVDYSYFGVAHVLQRLLPPGVEVPSSFETVGHVAHLNLREELLPYKHLIGQVILDKNPRLKVVVNKVGSIESKFRVFEQEVLAGGGGTETEVRQHGARFRLDFRTVYWNSRLEREHQRLVESFAPGQAVLDAMAGIGPFAIPAARRGCTVYANDLNPASYDYLCTNIKLNKVGTRVFPFCLDGREFIRQAAGGRLRLPPPLASPAQQHKDGKGKGQPQQQQQQQQQPGEPAEQQQESAEQQQRQLAASAPQASQQPQQSQQQQQQQQPTPGAASAAAPSSEVARPFEHVVMNLPASAVEFLDALAGSFDPAAWEGRSLPLVHVYTFCRADETPAEMRARVECHLGGALDEAPACHLVRDVAPNKHMYCISFRLPAAIAFGGAGDNEGEAGGGKRQKLG